MNTQDYRNAPCREGPLADQWADKPHRLIYDLCDEVERLTESNAKLLAFAENVAALLETYPDGQNIRWDKVAADARAAIADATRVPVANG